MEDNVILPYTVIDIGTGHVISTGTTMHTEGLAGPGQRLMEVGTEPNTYFKNGVFNRYPPQPSPDFKFNYKTEQWFDARTLDQLRQAQWGYVKGQQAAALNAGVEAGEFGRFDADLEAKVSVSATLASLPSLPDDWSDVWTRYDNTVITVDKASFTAIALAVLGHVSRCHAIARELRDQINAATTPEAIAVIVWPTT